jgi:hypothetical protein
MVHIDGASLLEIVSLEAVSFDGEKKSGRLSYPNDRFSPLSGMDRW